MIGKVFRLLVLAGCLAASLLAAAPASAVPLDRSFGQGGLVPAYSQLEPEVIEYAPQFAVARDGRIYLLQAVYPCRTQAHRCDQSVSLARLRPDGERESTFAGDGELELPVVQGESRGIAVDSRGGLLIGFHDDGNQLTVIRVGADGALDRAFGVGGRVSLPCVCEDAEVRLLPQRSGPILVVLLRPGEARRGRKIFSVITARRLSSGGRIDETYGDDGLASATIDNATGPENAVLLADGSFAFSAEGYSGGGPLLGRIGPNGRFDRRFLRRSRAAIHEVLPGDDPKKENRAFVGGIVPRSGGRLDLFGGREALGFIVRIRPDGMPERDFGRGGLRRLPRPAVTVAATPSGRTFVMTPRLEREGWYAEFGLFTAWLDREGRALGRFSSGGRRTRYVGPFGQLELQGGRPLFLEPGYPDAGCRISCASHPNLYRFRAR